MNLLLACLHPLLLLLLLALPGAARAGGFDAHGVVPPPDDGRVIHPLTSHHPSAQLPGSLAVGLTGEYASQTLVRYVRRGEELFEKPVIDEVLGVNLGLAWSASRRVGLGLSAPLWLGSQGTAGGGPAFGDLHLFVPIGLGPLHDRGGFAVVPFVDLPTGNQERYLGDPRLGGGLVGAVGGEVGSFLLSANLGLEGRGNGGIEDNVSGGGAVRLAATAGWRWSDRGVLRLEWRHQADLEPAGMRGTGGSESPGELMLTARGTTRQGLWWSGGLGSGTNRGVGAAKARLYLGLGYSWAPGADEVEPVAEASGFVFRVSDATGAPIVGAEVEVDGERVGSSDADGTVVLDRQPRWRRTVWVRSAAYQDRQVLDPGADEVEVVLDWLPVPVLARVQDQAGRPLQARWDATGPGQLAGPTAEPGRVELALVPGTWTLGFEAEGTSRQERVVVVPPLHEDPIEVEVILGPDERGEADLVLRLVDESGSPVPGARVLLDGRPLGTTSTGGTIAVVGIGEGEHRIEGSADTFQTVERYEFALAKGRQQLDLVLQRAVGSVQVIARGPIGPVPDAVVRFFGPARLPPTPLGEDGQRTLVVRPGTWQVLVTSARFGVQEREVVVPEDDNALIVVEAVLRPAEDGAATLALAVVDPDGHPVSGARIELDGEPVGTTSTGGRVSLGGLLPGPRRVEVVGERYRPAEAMDLVLIEGVQEQVVTLEWLPGSVHFDVKAYEGPVPDAVVRFSGPGQRAPLSLDHRGEGYAQLLPGRWNVLVSSARYGMQQRDVQVPEDSRSLIEVDVVLSAGEGGVADLELSVVDPDGEPVDGAEVFLDGIPLGSTSTAGTALLRELSAGTRTLEIRAELFRDQLLEVLLDEGRQDLETVLPWAPGVVRVLTLAGGEPVDDATVRFAGPRMLPPVRVDSSGERLVRLAPGTWQALVASPAFGLQQREVVVGEEAERPQEVAFELRPVGQGLAELLVQVRGPDGEPVGGATVQVDGVAVGRTSAGGSLVLPEREPGEVDLLIEAPAHHPVDPPPFDLPAGRTERTVVVEWVPVPVQVVVRDTAGEPLDAEIRFDGPAERSPEHTGPAGVLGVELRPGTWKILASSAQLGVKGEQVVLSPGSEQVTVELRLEQARVEMTTAQVVIKEQVHFDFDRATLRPESEPVLAEVAATLLAHPGIVRVQVQGHTDARGDVAYNQRLSQRRAETVVSDLVRRGVAVERLVAQGYGPTRPVGSNDTEDGRASNRRVQFDIVELSP